LLAHCPQYTPIRSDVRADVNVPDPSACPICKQGELIIIELVEAEPIPILDTS
jgi:hypothetical protein